MNDNMIISDELLAAFLDGNTNAEDTMRVLKAAEQDEELRELIRIVSEVDEDMAGRKPAKVKELPMTAMAARKKESYLCDIECEEFVLHQLGIETTHKTLLDEAYHNCWLRDKGMPLYNIGRLLEKNNLAVSRRYDSSMDDVVRWLEHGNQLIAVVDNTMLDPATHNNSQMHPNHAVAICSVSVASNEITLFNPYTEEELTTYPLPLFLKAWKQSNHYLVVVNTTDSLFTSLTPFVLTMCPSMMTSLNCKKPLRRTLTRFGLKPVLTKAGVMGPSATIKRRRRPTWCLIAISLKVKSSTTGKWRCRH